MDVNLCKPLKVNRDRGVPVGLFAGADVVVVTYAVAGGVPEPGDLLPIISIKLARILAIISAALFDSEPDVLGGGYRIHGSSGNHKFAEMPTHSHRIPTKLNAMLTLIYRSLERNGRRKRDGWEKNSQNDRRHILRQYDSLENRAKRTKKRAVNAVERIVWKNCVGVGSRGK